MFSFDSAKRTLSNLTRGISSFLPSLDLVAHSGSFKPNGISLMLRTKNEEWIDLSLRSVKEFADEVVIVDASTDDTPSIIRKVASEENLNIKLVRYKEKTKSVMSNGNTYTDQSNMALENTSYKWIFKWDGDMIARTSGGFNIKKLREKILKLNGKKYYAVFIAYANLDGDLFHTSDKSFVPSKEGHLFTYSPKLKFENIGRFEVLKLPLYYKPIIIRDVYIFHLRSVKSALRLLYRRFWTDWRDTNDYQNFPTLQKYIKYKMQNDWGITEVNEAARFNLMQLCRTLIPYDNVKYGDYPELLKEQLINPKYKLIYRQENIVGRNDVGIF